MNAGKTPDTARDPLLERYHEANALDATRPDPRLRETVLAHARAMATRRPDGDAPSQQAPANDRLWNWRLVASLATLGLVGLLVLQFERSPDEEREIALGTGMPQAEKPQMNAAQDAAPAAAAAPEAAAAPPAPERLTQGAGAAPDSSVRSRSQEAPPDNPDSAQPQSTPPRTAHAFESPVGGAQDAVAEAPPASPVAAAPVMAAPAPEATPAPSAKRVAPAEASAEARREPVEGRSRMEAMAPQPSTSPLFAAIAAGDRPQLEQLLRSGERVDARGMRGQTPLMAAARRGDRAMVQVLLDAGANRSLRDADGLSAADHARQSGHEPLLPLLE